MRIGILIALLVAGCAQVASAVIVAGNYATGSDTNVNRTAPADDPGFQYVGSVADTAGVNGASAIYLGMGWVLTAKHVTSGPTTFTFFDSALGHDVTTTYQIVPNSAIFLKNPAGTGLPGAGQNSDLQIYRLDTSSSPYGAPDLPSLVIAASSPNSGDLVTGIGRGWDRGNSIVGFNSSWGTTSPYTNYGYQLGGGTTQHMRWGDNTVTSQAGVVTQVWNVGTTMAPLYVSAFETQFDRNGATANEFQATNGDSGGAVFRKVDGVWQLTGMIDAVTSINGTQPVTDAVFGTSTIIADLSIYRSQILAHVPEPGTGVLAATGLLLLLAVARRRRAARG